MSFNVSNLFESSMFQGSQERNDLESIIQKRCYTSTNANHMQATTSTPMSPEIAEAPAAFNEEMMGMLKEILENQKELAAKMTTLEANQVIIHAKVAFMVEGQGALTHNQGIISEQVEHIQQNVRNNSEK
ncbi:PREDICTED: uncharacterized protein LOC108359942 [Rhagoletis zephyria]|uniref:uncharacterized protein LOC108359942 n=1 Tax=Rhagoletis zephyria TaxID=28612 RepID=UPI0008114DB4|nr:PREDICTED: uncharacterized protein LOC108359942 [Rhagoletis zephyria]